MFKDIKNIIEKQYEKNTLLSCLMVSAIVLFIDYITGRSIQFPITYVLPIGLAAWQGHKNIAYTLSIIMPVARIGFHFPWGEIPTLSVTFFNALISVVALVFYAYLLGRVSMQTGLLKKRVKVLEGILPICASCKRIRTDDGRYEQIESYISRHTEAFFSHGICPECAKKLYPDLHN